MWTIAQDPLCKPGRERNIITYSDQRSKIQIAKLKRPLPSRRNTTCRNTHGCENRTSTEQVIAGKSFAVCTGPRKQAVTAFLYVVWLV